MDRRKYPRCEDNLPVVIDGNKGYTINLGLGGLLAYVEKHIPLLESIVIYITTLHKSIQIEGTCIRCRRLNNHHKVAIFFNESTISREAKTTLRGFLTRKEESDPQSPRIYL